MQEVHEFPGHLKPVQTVLTYPNAGLIVSGSKDKFLKFWSIDAGECVKTLLVGEEIYALAFHQNMLFAGLNDGTIKVCIIPLLLNECLLITLLVCRYSILLPISC